MCRCSSDLRHAQSPFPLTTWHLRDDLAEDGDDGRGQKESHQARCELRHHDRQQSVHGNVAEEQRAQQQVTVCPHRLDSLRSRRGITGDEQEEERRGERVFIHCTIFRELASRMKP